MRRRILTLMALIAITATACDSNPTSVPEPQRSTVTTHDRHVPISGSLISPCNGETVNLDGYAHFRNTTTDNGDGTVTIKWHVNTQRIQGRGLTTGSLYNYIVVYQTAGESETTYPYRSSQWVNQTAKLTASGNTPNFLAHVMVTYTWDGTSFTADYKQSRTECK